MDAKELMIGDWVEVARTECVADGGHYITWSEYGKVIGITDSYIEVEVRDGEYNVDAHEDELKPIPLTPEILKKNGFERVNGEYQDVFYICDGIELLIDDEYTLFGQCKMPIKYVHQLQHALRLCRINKEIII